VTRRARDWLRKTAWMPCHNDKDVPSKTNQNDKNKSAQQASTTKTNKRKKLKKRKPLPLQCQLLAARPGVFEASLEK